MQVAYKSATYTQGTRLLYTASRTATSINYSHYQIQSPSSAHHPRKMKCCLAHKWSIRLSILFSECEERTRERGKWSDQKHDKPLPSVHRLSEGKGTSRFWNGNPSTHLRRRVFPDKRPYHRTVTRNGCCRKSLYLKKSLVDMTHESLYLLCADKQTHGRERHSSSRCCMNAAPKRGKASFSFIYDIQKHGKAFPSVHRLTERKGIPCFCKLIPRHIFGVESFLTSGHIIALSPAMAAVGKACT